MRAKDMDKDRVLNLYKDHILEYIKRNDSIKGFQMNINDFCEMGSNGASKSKRDACTQCEPQDFVPSRSSTSSPSFFENCDKYPNIA